MLACLADDHNPQPQFEEIVSKIGIIIKRIFSVVGWMIKPDWCCLTDKIFDALMFINCNKDFKHWSFLFKIESVCCSGVTGGREEGRFDSPDQLNVKTRLQPSLYFGFNILLIGFQ